MAGKEIYQNCAARSSYLTCCFQVFCFRRCHRGCSGSLVASTRKTILDMRPFYGKRAMKTTSLVTHREAQNCYLTSKVFLTINSTSVKVVHV